ncbi:MAG TPA: hypothetical protein PLL75_05365 [Candidatus Omnitrophota bacterium]|nr:hypothetical protein [Candidatus Omnitrophota bacterium]HPS37137.1 hypothetical protein [Candidatus Omnitrophota bacterium]
MFCPKCKYEYREGFIRCSRCEVDLVERLNEDTAKDQPVFFCPQCKAVYPENAVYCSGCRVDLVLPEFQAGQDLEPDVRICPQCNAEYRGGISQCADCYLELLPINPQEDEPFSETPLTGELVCVVVFDDLYRAQTARSILEGGGIQCAFENDVAIGVLPQLAPVFGGIKLFVQKENETAAKTILAGIQWDPPGGQRALF